MVCMSGATRIKGVYCLRRRNRPIVEWWLGWWSEGSKYAWESDSGVTGLGKAVTSLLKQDLLLGSDVDASSLDEIQAIESLMLVPALSVRAPSSVCAPASLRAYDPALSQIPAGPLMVSIVWFRDTHL